MSTTPRLLTLRLDSKTVPQVRRVGRVMASWRPQRVPKQYVRLEQCWSDEASLQRCFSRQQLVSEVAVVILGDPRSAENGRAQATVAASEALSALESLSFRRQRLTLPLSKLVSEAFLFPRGDAAPVASNEATAQRRPLGWTAVARDPDTALIINAADQLILQVDERVYTELGLIGRGHRRDTGRRNRKRVRNGGADIVLDLGAASYRPGKRLYERVQACFGRLTHPITIDATTYSGTEVPFPHAADAVSQTGVALVDDGDDVADLSAAMKRLLHSTAGAADHDTDRDEAVNSAMEWIGTLLLPTPTLYPNADECNEFLHPLGAPYLDPSRRRCLRRLRWGADRRSLLPRDFVAQVLHAAWRLRQPLDAHTDVLVIVRTHAAPANAATASACRAPRCTGVLPPTAARCIAALLFGDDLAGAESHSPLPIPVLTASAIPL